MSKTQIILLTKEKEKKREHFNQLWTEMCSYILLTFIPLKQPPRFGSPPGKLCSLTHKLTASLRTEQAAASARRTTPKTNVARLRFETASHRLSQPLRSSRDTRHNRLAVCRHVRPADRVSAPLTLLLRSCAQMEAYMNVWTQRSPAALLY